MRKYLETDILPFTRKALLRSSIAMIVAMPSVTIAQSNDPEVEEVVVTGTFIRNSSFAGASPVDVHTQDSLYQSGSINTAQFMRDLVYTDNIDAVSNVLGGAGGGQDGNTSGFNLRGLGSSSTLTLFDGRRVINTEEAGSIVPDIALSRMEVVLDGGSALYGSDAVAGVINMIPIKRYDGIRARTNYGRDQEGGFEEYSAGLLFGRAINDFEVVAAVEYKKHTPLMRIERPKYLRADNDIFTDGPPGTFRPVNSNTALVDPSCGTFGNDQNDKGLYDSFPSGFRLNNQARCGIFFGQWINYKRPNEQYSGYMNVTHETTDWLQLEYQLSVDHNTSIFITEAASPINSVRSNSVIIPATHPANPFGQAVRPLAYRTFTGRNQSPQPSYVKTGSNWDDTLNLTDKHSFTARYELGNDWSGYTSISQQVRRNRYTSYEEQADRFVAAINGMGGPSGNEWFNPFMSSDPRSPFYIAGVTSNTQTVVDWLSEEETTETSRNRLRLFDSVVTGPIADLPAGPAQIAFGVHARDIRLESTPIKANAAGNNLNAPPIMQVGSEFDSLVRSAFLEVEIPILETLSIQGAARYEKFEDLNLRTTTPKVAFRWEAHPTLAIRGSWGEGFLAPEPNQVGPINFNSCASTRDGEDLLTGRSFIGVDACTTSNPDLQVEESTLQSIGFTWEPLDGLSLGLDYQEIKYTGRIFTLANQDIGTQDYVRVLNGIGVAPGNFDRNPSSASFQAARAFVNANPSPYLIRDPVDLRPLQMFRNPQNVDQMDVKTFDMKARYSFSGGDLGDFTLSLDATYFTEYLLTEFDGTTREMGGAHNGDTGKAPPLPELKFNFGIAWIKGNHSGRILTKYTDDIEFGPLSPITRLNPPIINSVVRPTEVGGGYRADLSYNYAMSNLFGFGQSANVGVNVRNMFDWEPQRLPIQGGLETRLYDPFGRVISVSLDIEL